MVRSPGRVVAIALGLLAGLAACGNASTPDPLATADGAAVRAAPSGAVEEATEPPPAPTVTTTGPSVVAVVDGGIRLPAASGQQAEASSSAGADDGEPSSETPTTPATVAPTTVAPESTTTPTSPQATDPPTSPPTTPSTTAPPSTAPSSTEPPTTDPPSSAPTTTAPVTVVEFRIAPGTGGGPWNSFDTPVRVTVGQILRIHNDDSVAHGLHASGSPFEHGQQIQPGGSRDHQITSPHTPNQGSPRVYDHVAGRGAPFWIVATAP